MKPLGWIGLVILIAGLVAALLPRRLALPSLLDLILIGVGVIIVFLGRK